MAPNQQHGPHGHYNCCFRALRTFIAPGGIFSIAVLHSSSKPISCTTKGGGPFAQLPGRIQEIENNLSLANVDFFEFLIPPGRTECFEGSNDADSRAGAVEFRRKLQHFGELDIVVIRAPNHIKGGIPMSSALPVAKPVPITVAHGDGIGPEIMAATLQILKAAGALLDIETIEIGEKVYLRGNTAGIEDKSWDSLRRTKVFLKAPITTPQGGGFKSLNVTTRKALGLYANVRPCVSYNPYVKTKHPGMDLVIVRENEEDLYAGIEYRLSTNVMQTLKLISRPGCEKIVRYAFDYARAP